MELIVECKTNSIVSKLHYLCIHPYEKNQWLSSQLFPYSNCAKFTSNKINTSDIHHKMLVQ